MRSSVRGASLLAASLFLVSCAGLNNIHDPQFGVVDRAVLPGLLKSIRCELITFYDANRRRQQKYRNYVSTAGRSFAPAPADPERALAELSHFDLKDELYGMFLVNLKVTDTLNLPGGGTAATNRHVTDATHSKTWHVGPTASGVGTSEFQWLFAVPQNARLVGAAGPAVIERSSAGIDEDFNCFNELNVDFDGLARGKYAELERFRRVYVNGVLPLAGWLQENSKLISTVYLTPDINRSEVIFPAQMFYSFSLQVSGGVNARFSLVSPQWNPLAIDMTAQVQQTSNVQIFINGNRAAYANAAKTGTSTWVQTESKAQEVIVRGPVTVIIQDKKDIMLERELNGTEERARERAKAVRPPARPAPRYLDRDPGTLMYPPTISPPGPTQ